MTTIHVTDHALMRYHERCDRTATREQVAQRVSAAERAPAWVPKCVGHGRSHGFGECVHLVNGEMIYVTRVYREHVVVTTCMPLEWAEWTRRTLGTKFHKKKNMSPNRKRG